MTAQQMFSLLSHLPSSKVTFKTVFYSGTTSESIKNKRASWFNSSIPSPLGSPQYPSTQEHVSWIQVGGFSGQPVGPSDDWLVFMSSRDLCYNEGQCCGSHRKACSMSNTHEVK